MLAFTSGHGVRGTKLDRGKPATVAGSPSLPVTLCNDARQAPNSWEQDIFIGLPYMYIPLCYIYTCICTYICTYIRRPRKGAQVFRFLHERVRRTGGFAAYPGYTGNLATAGVMQAVLLWGSGNCGPWRLSVEICRRVVGVLLWVQGFCTRFRILVDGLGSWVLIVTRRMQMLPAGLPEPSNYPQLNSSSTSK